MKSDIKKELQIEKFRRQLECGMTFPGEYPFKFIVQSDSDAQKKIEDIFAGTGAALTATSSSKGNYTAITIVMKAKTPDDIIEKYSRVAEIPDVIKL